MYFETLKDIMKSDIFQGSKEQSEFMILVGKDSKSELSELLDTLTRQGVNYFGGFFPKLIANGQAQSTGFIVKKFNPIYSERVYPFLMKKSPILEEGKAYTGIIIGDGLSMQNKDLIETVSSQIQGNINYIGGCAARYVEEAGVPSIEQNTAIFNRDGFFQDALHLCIIEQESKSSLAFGWEVLDGPFEVTSMEKETVVELSYQNPYEIYHGTIEAIYNTVILEENIHTVMTHPFGLMENGHVKNVILPDGITEEGYLKFYRANLKEGDELYILKGDHDSMIRGVGEAMEGNSLPITAEITVFSCMTRELVLDDLYSDEIQCIDQRYNRSAEGTLSFGEFSNQNDKKELRIYAGACVITY